MRKRLFACGTALSLLMLIGVVVFWIWSRSHSGYVRVHQGAHFMALYPAPNALTITTWHDESAARAPKPMSSAGRWTIFDGFYAYLVNRAAVRWQHLGIQWSVLAHLQNGRSLIIPNGFLLALFTLLPLLWLRSWSRTRRTSAAHAVPVSST